MEACRHIISGAGIEIATRTGVKGERSYELFSAGTLICIGDSDLRHLSQRCLDLVNPFGFKHLMLMRPIAPLMYHILTGTVATIDPNKMDLSNSRPQQSGPQ